MALVQISLAGETESRRQHWIRQEHGIVKLFDVSIAGA